MDPTAFLEAVQTFMGITGAPEALATQLVQRNGGDLNAAINAYYNEGDDTLVRSHLQHEAPERIPDYMEEDELIPVHHTQSSSVPMGLPARGQLFDSILGPGSRIGTGFSPHVSHPRDVRPVHIDWRDEEISSPHASRADNLVVEEVSEDHDVPRRLNTQPIISMDDEVPPSFINLPEERGPRHFGVPSFPSQYAPQITEVPPANPDNYDVEEEMLQAAIEASRKEAEEANRRMLQQETVVVDNDEPALRMEDDDLARAVSLSLKTAEQEKLRREQQGTLGADTSNRGLSLQDDEVIGPAMSNIMKGTLPSSSAPREENEEPEEPLLRRRSTRRPVSSSNAQNTIISAGAGAGDEVSSRSQQISAAAEQSAREADYAPSAPSEPNGGLFQADEWGGISSEEQDEAVMLEAAMFGHLSQDELPYRLRTGVHSDVGFNSAIGTEGTGRRIPQPPSPTVVAQRLLREQQDDEYLASLAADREKELRALQEAEARRVEEEAAAAAASEEKRRQREQQLKQAMEVEELERRLDAKKNSLPPEPANEDEEAVTLLVRFPDGSRQGRRFKKSDRLQCLFDFIDVGRASKPGTYRLVRQYPRRAFTDEEHGASFAELGLSNKQEVLFLELI